ncbi:60S ribosomal subunit assembly/export protein loc1 [Aspergillus fumigatus]
MALEQQNVNNTQLLDIAVFLKLLANLRPDCGYREVQGVHGLNLGGLFSSTWFYDRMTRDFASAQLTAVMNMSSRNGVGVERTERTGACALREVSGIDGHLGSWTGPLKVDVSFRAQVSVTMDGLEVEVWDLRRMVLPPSFCEKFRPHLFGERDLLWSTPITDMAPNKPSVKGKSSSKGDSGKSKPLSSSSKVSKKHAKRPPPKEVKSKARTESSLLKKTKKREYTEEELGLPKLNMITPVGVVKPKGKKKGKVFVDDQEGMMTILAMVNAEQEGHIESKLQKARQLEEIREAKRKEAEARHAEKKNKLEEAKQSIRQKRKRKSSGNEDSKSDASTSKSSSKSKEKRKSVSFA